MKREMDRDEYLSELKRCIQALPLEEQEEALEYYRDYFDDADNDSKVIEELGDPEKLAEEIKEKFACVPAKMADEKSSGASDNTDHGTSSETGSGSSSGNVNHGNFSSRDAMKFSFNADEVKNLDFSFGAAEIVMIPGDKYTIETRGIDSMNFRCELSVKGTLIVDNRHQIPFKGFFDHNDNSTWKPRILITIPENARLDIVKVSLAAGSFTAKTVAIHCNSGFFDVNAGNLVLDRIYGGQLNAHCGMGNLELCGTAKGVCDIDCGMGKIALKVTGNPSDYSYNARVGFGEIRFNGEKKSGIGSMICTDRKANHFSINCGMGSVTVDVK
ncbi:MAG: DUF1700 domain-containing protein [Treponemataceae bacterium]|nr:DUF1700 domain-containing protein [Treponemataceae bacterium]